MIFLQNVHEARERLADIAEQLGNGEIHSAVLLNEGVPVSVMVPWADFCVMLEALEAVSGAPSTKEGSAHAALTCGEPADTSAACASCAGGNVAPEERPPVSVCTSSESRRSNSAVEAAAAEGKSCRLALDPILLD